MNPGWERRRIAELAHHSLGKMLDKAKNRGEPRPYLRNLNVRWFEFDLSDVSEMRFLPSEAERYSVRKGDVVVCEGGYPGRAAIWQDNEPIYFQKALHRLRFHEPAHAQWFLYYLHAKDLDGTLKAYFNGAGIQHFTGEALARFELPIPPLDEQRRIVAVLDEAFAGIAAARANAERNLRNARALFDAEASSAFDNESVEYCEVALADVCGIESALIDPRDPPYPDMLHVGGANMVAGTGALVDLRTAREEGLTSGKFRFDPGVVLYSKIRPYLKKAARPDFPGLCSADIYPLTVMRDRLDAGYLFRLLLSRRFTEYAVAGSARAGMPKVNREHLFAYRFALPPIEAQRAVVRRLDELADSTALLSDVYQRKLAALDELKRSLLHHAFTGQLTARTTTALVG